MYFLPLNSTHSSVHIYNIHQLSASTVDIFMAQQGISHSVTLLEHVCMYVHTVLQNGLQISSANKCVMI